MDFESIQDDMQKLSQMMNQPQQLELLRTSVSLVDREKPLQTSAVTRQICSAGDLASNLRAYLDLKSSSKNDGKVRDILNQLNETQNDLMQAIKAALVGAQGNTQEGIRVKFTELQRTNREANRVLGTNLDLWSGLGHRRLEQGDGIITLDSSDAEALGFGDPQITAHGASDRTETSIYANITKDQARIMTGDIGIEEWQKVAARKTTIAHNQFGKDARIMTGDQGKAGAAEFNANFWK